MIALKTKFCTEDEGKNVKTVDEELTGKVVLRDMTSFGEFSEWHEFDHTNVLSLLSIFC